jgi:regulator of RNase E activity RraA
LIPARRRGDEGTMPRLVRSGGARGRVTIEHRKIRIHRSDQPRERSTHFKMTTPEPQAIADATRQALEGVTTATLTTVLLKKGLRNVWIRGALPVAERLPARRVGRAFTLRFVPAREDLATPASWASPISTRAAIEAMPAGAIAVVDAMGTTDAGIFGDILCARMARRGVAALVSDGVVRDLAGVLGTELPVWCQGAAAPASVNGLTFVGWQEAIGCGGVAVMPNDVIVADGDGAVVIPAALVAEVVDAAVEQERLEGWIMGEVERGVPLPGLYPANEATAARYRAWVDAQQNEGQDKGQDKGQNKDQN